MIVKQAVEELFPTPLWVVDVAPQAAEPFNAMLVAQIEKIVSRPKVPSGSNWQTPHDLHLRPEFAELVQLIEKAARGVARYLEMEQFPMMITGCWANINPPGSYHPTHNHPNNFLSGVYYVAVPSNGSHLAFHDPRPISIMPRPAKAGRVTSNSWVQATVPGRMVLFPSWLRHFVPSNEGDSERVSIAFNLMFTNFAETVSAPRWKPSAGAA
jgi:uncharacterized protein (TIGR02466 family)